MRKVLSRVPGTEQESNKKKVAKQCVVIISFRVCLRH